MVTSKLTNKLTYQIVTWLPWVTLLIKVIFKYQVEMARLYFKVTFFYSFLLLNTWIRYFVMHLSNNKTVKMIKEAKNGH